MLASTQVEKGRLASFQPVLVGQILAGFFQQTMGVVFAGWQIHG
jgi:hypothetical protein